MTSNSFQQSRQAYAQGVGTTGTGRNLLFTRDPNANDVNYALGTFWQNTADESLWYLNSQSSTGGTLQSNWINIESSIATLSDTSNTPVHASSGLSNPPNNIQLTNLDGSVTIVSDPSDNRIVISSTSALTPEVTIYIVGPHGNYSTIQSAINQAVTNGASASVQAEIWIADGQYTEDLTLADYVNLVGLSNGPSNAVQIIGSASYSGVGSFAATNVAFIEPADSAALTLSTGTTNTVSLNSVLINGSTGGGYGFRVSSSGVTATLTNCQILAGTTTNPFAIEGGYVEFISLNSSSYDTGSLVYGGTLVINGGQINDNLVINNSGTVVELYNVNFTAIGTQQCISGSDVSSTLSAYNSTFYSTSSGTYFVTGPLTFNYANIEATGTAVIIDPAVTQVAQDTYIGNITFDGGNTTLDTNGQVWIGSSSGIPVPATLTAGTNISIANAANSITISSSGSAAFAWNVISTSQTVVPFNGYLVAAGMQIDLLLPSSSNVGDTFTVVSTDSYGFSITLNSSQEIRVNGVTTTPTTGSVSVAADGASITLVCYVGAGIWYATEVVGVFTIV